MNPQQIISFLYQQVKEQTKGLSAAETLEVIQGLGEELDEWSDKLEEQAGVNEEDDED